MNMYYLLFYYFALVVFITELWIVTALTIFHSIIFIMNFTVRGKFCFKKFRPDCKVKFGICILIIHLRKMDFNSYNSTCLLMYTYDIDNVLYLM